MRDPRAVLRAAAGLPLGIARRVPGGDAVERLVDRVLPGRDRPAEKPPEAAPSGGRAAERPGDGPPAAGPAAEAAIGRERELREYADTPAPPTAGHVESEVELVADVADAEAAESPGAELHVDEPWEGYRRMKVAEIRTRLDGQPPEVLAAVELYESTHRKRQGVLSAVRAAASRR